MLLKVKKNVEDLTEARRFIVGFSGGADSCALVYCLKKLGYDVIAVHVNHLIRSEEAERDARFTEEFCKKQGITYFCERIDIPRIAEEERLSLETAARIERYRIFERYASEYDADIAVAHNKNDQAETVLMHLLRGSGLNGLCGMHYKSGKIIRPLLNVSRQEIEGFLFSEQINYITDSTNYDDDYRRNFLRLNIIPEINEKFSSDVTDRIFSCAEILTEYEDYFNSIVEAEASSVTVQDNTVSLNYKDKHKLILIDLIKLAISKLQGNVVDIERAHLMSVYDLIFKESGKSVDLPGNISVRKEYEKLIFFFRSDDSSYEYNFELNKEYLCAGFTVKGQLAEKYISSPDCEFLDFSKLPSSLTLRTRRDGDYIYLLGSGGKKSIKKLFSDKKLPMEIRNSIPLLAHNSEVFAIVGLTVSEKVKITDSTEKILRLKKEHC